MDNQGSFAPERVVWISDPAAHLDGVIVVHSTRLGPAAGGCRLWDYQDEDAMLADAVRLAEGMSYKNALAGLPFGGGKAVLRRPHGTFDRAELFRAFGRAVESLSGAYVTAEDVGTSVADMVQVSGVTGYVSGLAQQPGKPGGDPSPWTARGVSRSIEAVARHHLGRPLSELRVAVQGLGSVGAHLCGLLHDAGAKLVVADVDRARASAMVATYGAVAVEPDEITGVEADVFAPCALGATIDETAIKIMCARVVCGAANNQLATPGDGERLARAGILYAPDFLVNAGGIISVAGEFLGWRSSEVARRVDAISYRLSKLLVAAKRAGVRPECMALRDANAIIAQAPEASSVEAVR